jgi:hypothetical protein
MATNTFTYTELTDQDKVSIVKNRIRNIEYSIFDLGLSKIEAENSTTPEDATAIETQIAGKKVQLALLKDMLPSLQA